MTPVPHGARQLATYFYPHRVIHVYALNRAIFLRDETGQYPAYDEGGAGIPDRMPHPDEGKEITDFSYDCLGLYYGYKMPDTGWDGDC